MTNILGLLKRVRDGVRSCLQVTPADAEVDTADNMWEFRGKNWSQRNREQPTEVCGKTTSNNYMDWGVVFTLSRQGIWLELGVLLLTSFWFLHCDHRTFKGQVFSPKLLNVYFFLRWQWKYYVSAAPRTKHGADCFFKQEFLCFPRLGNIHSSMTNIWWAKHTSQQQVYE